MWVVAAGRKLIDRADLWPRRGEGDLRPGPLQGAMNKGPKRRLDSAGTNGIGQGPIKRFIGRPFEQGYNLPPPAWPFLLADSAGQCNKIVAQN